MKFFSYILIILMMPNDLLLFDFEKESHFNQWKVEDDVVMGGRSQGHLKRTDDGKAAFSGHVSLENNGGFSQIQTSFEAIDVSNFSKFKLKIKGDNKEYQFRVKENRDQKHVYVKSFTTSGEWQTVELNFKDFKPRFRGRDLDKPNYNGKSVTHTAILIGNKKEQDFKLLIDKIWVE